jgi:hypothetical protein
MNATANCPETSSARLFGSITTATTDRNADDCEECRSRTGLFRYSLRPRPGGDEKDENKQPENCKRRRIVPRRPILDRLTTPPISVANSPNVEIIPESSTKTDALRAAVCARHGRPRPIQWLVFQTRSDERPSASLPTNQTM